MELPKAEISILLLDDIQITGVNREYLKRDRPTDVISFPMFDSTFPNVQPHLLGDVVISVETAGRYAAEKQSGIYKEITALLIHGVLHLLGYDHEVSDEEDKKMRTEEKKIFRKMLRSDLWSRGQQSR